MSTRGLPHYWTPDQVNMVLDALPSGLPWLFGLLLWRTGLRQAEALNLEWRDLQFASTQPSVTVRNGKGGRFRVVPAHPELVDAFRSVPHRSPADKVFTGRGSKPLSPRSAARWIAEGIAKAGLQAAAAGTGVKGPASHSLRHSCARHWLQSGLNVNAVSAWLGHSSPTVTLNTYLELAPDTLGDVAEETGAIAPGKRIGTHTLRPQFCQAHGGQRHPPQSTTGMARARVVGYDRDISPPAAGCRRQDRRIPISEKSQRKPMEATL